MSRIAKAPISLPESVQVAVANGEIEVKGPKGTLTHTLPAGIDMAQEEGQLKFTTVTKNNKATAITGTTRSLVNNMVIGVSNGFERQLKLVGVGYRAESKGDTLVLNLGFSHPVHFNVPEGITITVPNPKTPTDIVIQGIDKQKVGQVAAKIRAYRPPEPYKGKGVKYSDEVILRKETKKKK